jgi:repressor LexA
MRLTRRQHDVLAAVVGHIDQHGVPPTRRELGATLGIRSPNGVTEHLVALEARGLIRRGPHGTARALVVTPSGREAIEARPPS